jgi:DNA repair protein RadC
MTTSATHLFVCEQTGEYRLATPDEVRAAALANLLGDLTEKPVLNSPSKVKDYLRLQIGDLPHEVFSVMFLDPHNRLLAYEQMFRGSLSQTMVYPREVVKRALVLGADGVILTHNHPGGTTKPSQSDMKLTRTLQEALALVDVTVRDHIIVARGSSCSMAEDGLL